MRVLLFFNELSCTTQASRTEADDAMSQFVGVLRTITSWRRDMALVSAVPLKAVELAQGYFLGEWAKAGRNRDQWRYVQGLRNRAPFTEVLPAGAGDDADYRCEGSAAGAVGAAHLLDGIVVSLAVEDRWDTAWLRADREVLAEQADGEVSLVDEQVEVRHAAARLHLDEHEERIKETGLQGLRHGGELWELVQDAFPHLRFLPRVETDLRGLRHSWLIPVIRELRLLEASIAAWQPARVTFPEWGSKITAEGDHGKAASTFTDFDGESRAFDLHARFTPGAGRLHFRLVPDEQRATVAYIGPKRKR
ncbi:MAG: hypothetical protein ABIS86_02455 [Streptosporangiaceae bacterium]